VVLFSLVKKLKQSPEALGHELGKQVIAENVKLFLSYNVIKGFLNFVIADEYWAGLLHDQFNNASYGKAVNKGQVIMVEYSSPNTNKPLHLGHLRNCFLGWSIAAILKANGYEVIKSCVVNDRGIHICKSMIAWQRFGNGETPLSAQKKGDHFVGDYYVKFNNALNEEIALLVAQGMEKTMAEKEAPLMKEAQEMLLKWEQGDREVIDLWRTMNGWVYAGFDETYRTIGIDFDRMYYESETYLSGKKYVEEGLQNGVFYKKDDGSVWIDLTADGLDEKLVLRKDGTSVYITQDIGLSIQKYEEYSIDQSIYVIGDEQNYHIKVLKLICRKLGMPYAESIYHLSYGMVELPSGKMKSREGTVVDADELVEEMIGTARHHTMELGKVKDFQPGELQELYEVIGLGAMKFYLLRVDPKKKMIFNPEESIDFHGFTGSFIQYTHARIKSILRKHQPEPLFNGSAALLPLEKKLIILLEQYPGAIEQAANEHNPSVLANYAFELAKVFNSFYSEHSVVNAETEEKKQLRLRISQMTANIINSSMQLLGIRVPERM
jgi:arginyl-tRNA synthetase